LSCSLSPELSSSKSLGLPHRFLSASPVHVSASTGFSSLKPNDFAGHRSTVRSCAALWLAEVSLFSFRFLLVLGYCAPISAFVLSAHPSFLGLFLEVSSTHSKSRLPQ